MTGRSKSPTAHRKVQTRGRRMRRRIAVVASVALVLGILTVVVLTLWVGNRALVAKESLQKAQSQLVTFKSALGQPNAPSTTRLYAQLAANTGRAADQVDDPIWATYEKLPVLGPNLIAFRQVAQLTDALVVHGVKPVADAADGISVESLKPKDGGIDIEPLKKLTPAVAELDDALQQANRSLSAIDTRDVVPQLAKPIGSLHGTLDQALPLTAELRKVMPVLYPALGGNGTRHYLLMFQNNAEERASGGAPNALAMLTVDHGRIKLGRQAGTGVFPQFQPPGVMQFGGDWNKLYGSYVTTKINQTTFTPDFPTTARIARTMWRLAYGGKVDGIISFDPVALSYLMRATGPVKLTSGETLTADNAVPFLLSGVYAKYTDPAVQDVVFSSAADAIFKAVTSGQGDPKAYVQQLDPIFKEQRLKMWSVRKAEQDLIATSPMGNMLPEDNMKATVVGVYNNDDSTSKMSFYMDNSVSVKVNRCKATPTYSVSTTITDSLQPSQVAGLTSYVLAGQHRIVPGGDRQYVNLYGPVGAKLVAAYIDGVKVRWGTNFVYGENTVPDATGVVDRRPAVDGSLYGRPVGLVSVKMGPLEHRTVRMVFRGGTDASSTVQVSHTPHVRPTKVEIADTSCGG